MRLGTFNPAKREYYMAGFGGGAYREGSIATVICWLRLR